MNTFFGTILGIVLVVVTMVGIKTYQGERSANSVEVVETEGAEETPPQLDKTEPILDETEPILDKVDLATIDAYLERAIARSQAGRYHEALDDLETYLKHRPGDAATAKIYGQALLKAAEFERAARFYRQSVETNPSDAEARYNLAWAYEQSGQFAKAIESYKKVSDFGPRRMVSRNNVAWILATAPDASLRDGKKAVEMALGVRQTLGRDEAWLADTLAAALAENGDFAAAIKVQQWAIKAKTGDEDGEMQQRLELYQQGKPYRMPKRPGDALKPKSNAA